MTRDFGPAIEAGGALHAEPWFVERTRETVAALGPDLERDLAPDERVSLLVAVMVAKKIAHPGLLAVVPGSRFVICWREGSQSLSETYQLDSVPAEVSAETVEGIDGPADMLVLTDRRIVVPSAAVAEHLRALFRTAPSADSGSEADTEVLAATPGPAPDQAPGQAPDRASDTAILPPFEPVPPQPVAPGPAGSSPVPARSAAGAPPGQNGSGRKVLLIVAAVVVGALLLGGAAFGIYRVTQLAGTGTGAAPSAPASEPGGDPTDEPSPPEPSEPDSALPQSETPLADDAIVIRRNDGGWKIETVDVAGNPVSVLATGQQNRGIVLSRDRRTVLYLRVAGGTSTLRAVAADGSDNWGLFSDGTSECPKLAQPALGGDNVLAVACSGSLNLMNLDGSLIRVLDRGRVGDPTFTREGDAIIYWKATGSGDGGALYKIPIDGSAGPTLLAADDDGPFDDPACSPVDDLVVASQTRGDERRIVTLSTTGESAEVTALSPEGSVATGPGWSPDGSRISYRVGTGDDSSLAVMNSDGSSATEILPAQTYLANPIWTAH